ncbi:MAG: hypothetical protein GTO22_14145 [Gemmatimonadales bacterium]|nr:hypothetical protein [Gemmatimonadales bacterium]
MSPPSAVGTLLNRAILAMLGLMIALLGSGVILLAIDQSDAVSIGATVACLIGLLLVGIGVRQVHAAARGRLPRWYGELLIFAGGVFVRGPRPRE